MVARKGQRIDRDIGRTAEGRAHNIIPLTALEGKHMAYGIGGLHGSPNEIQGFYSQNYSKV